MILMNLFESFDPSIYSHLMLNWMVMFIYMFLIPHPYWLIPSRLNMLWVKFLMMMFFEFKLLVSNKYQSNIIMFISLMVMLMLMNCCSLMPYIFTVTSHMSFNLVMSLSLWVSMMLYGWMNLPDKLLSHLVPLNTPFLLMNFMVYIELISNVIRPWTLAIRLTANLIAGHLLLTLIGSSVDEFMAGSSFIVLMILTVQNLLFLLEISMAFIQAYVYSVLSLLYFSEVK